MPGISANGHGAERLEDGPSPPILLYLDQSYWGRLAQPENAEILDRLAALVNEGVLIAPLSIFVFAESMKAPRCVRMSLLPVFGKLSGDTALKNPLLLMRLEIVKHLEGRSTTWVRQRLLTRIPIEMNPLVPPPSDSILDCLDIAFAADHTREETATIDEPLIQGAVQADVVDVPVTFTTSEVRAIFSPLQPPEGAEDIKLDDMPSFRVLRRLQQAVRTQCAMGHRPNDMVDFTYVSETLPYFDIVTVDKTTGARIKEAGLEDLAYGEVVSTGLDDLVSAVERAATRSVEIEQGCDGRQRR